MWNKVTHTDITTRIFFIISVLLIISIISCGVLLSIPTSHIIKENYISNSQRELELIAKTIASSVEHISNYATSISSTNNVIIAAKNHPDAPLDDATKFTLRSTVGKEILSIIGANNDIYAYDIFSPNGHPFNIGGTDMMPYINAAQDSIFSEAQQSLSATFHGPYIVQIQKIGIPVFFVTKPIVDLDTHQIYGILILVIKESKFSAVFPMNHSSSGACYITDGDGVILCARSVSEIGTNISAAFDAEQINFDELLRNSKQVVSNLHGEQLIVSDSISSRVPWRVFIFSSMDVASETWHRTFSSFIVMLLITAVLMIFGAFFISKQVTRPIHRLICSIESSTSNMPTQTLPDPKGSIEIHQLYTSFNNLITHIQNEQKEKSSYEFQLIQSQIKPHFLNNTLMTIKSLIDLGMNDTASDCIYAFASFYRLSLNRGNEILTISDEIELSSHYMYIQHLRYIDRLNYSFSVDDSIKNYYIPKMTLQPILENAIYHGIKEKPGVGTITVEGYEKDDSIVFNIIDNGNGMAPQEIEFLNHSFSLKNDSYQHSNTSFGLYSVNRRIQLMFGEEYGVTVSSVLQSYTCVSIKLAKLTERRDLE